MRKFKFLLCNTENESQNESAKMTFYQNAEIGGLPDPRSGAPQF